MSDSHTSTPLRPAVFEVVNAEPWRPQGSRQLGVDKQTYQQQQKEKEATAAAAAVQSKSSTADQKAPLAVWTRDVHPSSSSSNSNPVDAFIPRFDHICIAVSDVSEMSEVMRELGGRPCEGFLTPVYVSATYEFSNTAELQVIAPVESFAAKRAGLTKGERSTTTQAFFDGRHSVAPPVPTTTVTKTANTSTASSNEVVGPKSTSIPRSVSSGTAPYSTPSSRPRSTFLQRYLRRHGPSVHHVAFLVPSLERARKRFQSFGYTIYGWSDRDPLWKEFFLQPKQSLGCVIQIAQSGTLTNDLQWSTSTAMLSQTHLTPVVKRHVANMNAGIERWEAETKPVEEKPTKEKKSNTGILSTLSKGITRNNTSSSDSALPSPDMASPSHASSACPSLPPRLSMVGLRLRCASEFKARRQWSDMLQANSCTSFINPQTGIKTLCFRWAQSPLYLAVDIEKPPADWKEKSTMPSSGASSPPRRSSLDDTDSMWDGCKWIEFHSPFDAGAPLIPSEAAMNEMNLELMQIGNNQPGPSITTNSRSTSPTPDTKPTSSKKSKSSSSAPHSTNSSTPSFPSTAAIASTTTSIPHFSPTFRVIPLDQRIMRSKFVLTSEPIPIMPSTTMTDQHERIQLVTVPTTKDIRAKL